MSPVHTLGAACSEAVVSPRSHARGTQLQFYSRQQRGFQTCNLNCIAPISLFKNQKKKSISPSHSLPTHLSIAFLHSSSQWAAYGAEVNADVSPCLQSRVVFDLSPTSPLVVASAVTSGPVSNLSHTGPYDTTFPLPNLLNQQY